VTHGPGSLLLQARDGTVSRCLDYADQIGPTTPGDQHRLDRGRHNPNDGITLEPGRVAGAFDQVPVHDRVGVDDLANPVTSTTGIPELTTLAATIEQVAGDPVPASSRSTRCSSALHEVTGLPIDLCLILVPNLAALGGLLVLYRLVTFLEDEAAARWTLLLFISFPFAFSRPWPTPSR
jgi:hypothetical protein